MNAGFSSINSNLTPVQTRQWVCIFVDLASIAGEDSRDLGVFNFWRSRSSKAPRWNHETMRNTIETFLSSRMMVDGWWFFKGFIYIYIYMLLHRLLLRIFPDFLGVVCTFFCRMILLCTIFCVDLWLLSCTQEQDNVQFPVVIKAAGCIVIRCVAV